MTSRRELLLRGDKRTLRKLYRLLKTVRGRSTVTRVSSLPFARPRCFWRDPRRFPGTEFPPARFPGGRWGEPTPARPAGGRLTFYFFLQRLDRFTNGGAVAILRELSVFRQCGIRPHVADGDVRWALTPPFWGVWPASVQ